MDALIIFPFLLSLGDCSVIIPEELPSLLSVAYSNIPPIKKGTDSRVGFGFAFGNHADLQVMFELGPQTNTLSLNGQSFGANTKRQAPAPTAAVSKREKFLQSDAGKYLQSWAAKMNRPKKRKEEPRTELPSLEDSLVELVKTQEGHYEIHQPDPPLPRPALRELQRLYARNRTDETRTESERGIGEKRTEEEVRKITEDLSNVDLD